MAKKEKQPIHKVEMTEGKRQIIQQLLQEYDIETAEDIQEALKNLFGNTIKSMMEAEMDDHLGYEKSERVKHDKVTNYRNGTKKKGSITVLAATKLIFRRIGNPASNHRLSENSKRTFQTLTRKSFPCMPRE